METEKGSQAAQANTVIRLQLSAILIVLSSLLIIEGTIRWCEANPDTTNSYGTYEHHDLFPPLLKLLASAFEIFFGSTGLVAGFASLMGYGDANLTAFSMGCQFSLGLFTWLIQSMVEPIYNTVRQSINDAPNFVSDGALDQPSYLPLPYFPFGQFSHSRVRVGAAFGQIMASMCFMGLLQGGQFFIALKLFKVQKSMDHTADNKIIAAINGITVFFAGVGTLVLGVTIAKENRHILDGTDVNIAFPNVVSYCSLTIVSGGAMIIYSVILLLALVVPMVKKVVRVYAFLLFYWFLGGHVMANVGLASDAAYSLAGSTMGVYGGDIVLLCIAVAFVPLFFTELLADEA